jgi:crotonobetainyl-CoA:carnitine CoA-transferase CaiB-like acyl-CoA transferase
LAGERYEFVARAYIGRRSKMNGPLEGVRVLDLSRVLAGPFCTMTLGDLGAEIIKLERPGAGDDLRGWGPPFGPTGDSTYFIGVNRNKRSITVDLARESGRELVRELAARSDVLIENFRVGLLEDMGLGYEDLSNVNPGLVYCTISGFGRTGPWARRPGYDVTIQAFGGLMSVTGEPDGQPMRVGVAIVDLCTGLYAAIGILSALHARERTGRGQRVDLSLLETVLASLPNLTAGYLVADAVPQRLGTGHPNVTPYGIFPTKDGYIVLAIGNDEHWRKLCGSVGAPEMVTDPRYARNNERTDRRDEVEEMVSGWTTSYTTAELTELLIEHDVPHGPVNTIPEVLQHVQTGALGIVQDFPLNVDATAPMVRSPLTFSSDQRSKHLPPAALGTATREVLRDVGLDEEILQRFADGGAFGADAV